MPETFLFWSCSVWGVSKRSKLGVCSKLDGTPLKRWGHGRVRHFYWAQTLGIFAAPQKDLLSVSSFCVQYGHPKVAYLFFWARLSKS